jgi:hypothetical protein
MHLPDPAETLHLDRLDVNDPVFVAITAFGIHEIAHLAFGTYDWLDIFDLTCEYRQIAANVVADVCDEAAFIAGVTREALLPLATCNSLLARHGIKEDAKPSEKAAWLFSIASLPTLTEPNNPLSAYLPNPSVPSADSAALRELKELTEVCGLGEDEMRKGLTDLIEARDGVVQDASLGDLEPGERTLILSTIRSESSWDGLENAICTLTMLLEKYDPPSTPTPAGSDRQEQDEEDKPPEEDTEGKKSEKDSSQSDVMSQARQTLVDKVKRDRGELEPTALGADDSPPKENRWVVRNGKKFGGQRAAILRLMKELLRSKTFTLCKSSVRGPVVRDVERVYTDGKVFRRRDYQLGMNSAVAFLVDCSGSTRDYINQLTAFAGAMADGAREAGASTAAWLFGGDYMPVPTRRLSYIIPPNLGGTIISKPLEVALDWLSTHDDDEYKRKVLVIFSDGVPYKYDYAPTMQLASDAAADGVRIILGCVGKVDLSEFIESTMCGATAFTVSSNFGISALALTRKIAGNQGGRF